MFTGIIQGIGEIRAIESIGGDARLRICSGDLSLEKIGLGDSIAVSGVCLLKFPHDRSLAGSDLADDMSLKQSKAMSHGCLGCH